MIFPQKSGLHSKIWKSLQTFFSTIEVHHPKPFWGFIIILHALQKYRVGLARRGSVLLEIEDVSPGLRHAHKFLQA